MTNADAIEKARALLILADKQRKRPLEHIIAAELLRAFADGIDYTIGSDAGWLDEDVNRIRADAEKLERGE